MLKRYARFLFPFCFGLALGARAMRVNPQTGIELWGLALFVILGAIAFVELGRENER